jgi:Protein of unknown function (DUF3301).
VLSTLVSILVLGLVALAWSSGAKAREAAMAIGRAACEREGYQLLDDSVALQRFGLRWTSAGLRLRRMYRFDYSVEGTLRETGYVLLLGKELESVHIRGRHTFEQQEEPEEEEARSVAKVIPFPGNRHR